MRCSILLTSICSFVRVKFYRNKINKSLHKTLPPMSIWPVVTMVHCWAHYSLCPSWCWWCDYDGAGGVTMMVCDRSQVVALLILSPARATVAATSTGSQGSQQQQAEVEIAWLWLVTGSGLLWRRHYTISSDRCRRQILSINVSLKFSRYSVFGECLLCWETL